MSRIFKICKIFGIFSRSGDRELQRPVSRRRGDCGGQAPALRGRSSLSVGQDRQILTCSQSGDRELQRPVSRGRGERGGQAPALRFGRKLILKILLDIHPKICYHK